MKYGLLGKSLKHSYSKEIHELLGYYKYNILKKMIWINFSQEKTSMESM
ncbi:MAG: hypothetical protein E7I46_02985 [Finegoldia magna]|nr:hypothetical protein [Finegoldia magna]